MTRCIFFVSFYIFFCFTSFQAVSQGSVTVDTVVAQQGEGIFGLLRRYEQNPSSALPEFVELNRDRLGTDSSLMKGQKYLLPLLDKTRVTQGEVESHAYGDSHLSAESGASKVSSSSIVEPLFGPKYERITPKDRSLAGAVYYLVAGHSGPDPGAIGQYGPYQLSEDEYAYDVTLRLARRLMEHGATVYMIVQDKNDGIRDDPILPMDKDEVHFPSESIPANQLSRLKKRVATINKLYVKHKGSYQRMVALHIDSRSRGENIDVFFYHHANSTSGKQMATNIHTTFQKKYRRHQPSRNYDGSIVSRSGLYVIKNTYPPTVFIELGNIKNQKDQRRFVIPDNRQALANWITEGLQLDFSKK